jgi:Holliday junction DNA helicase RuvA
MIGSLTGILASKQPPWLMLDVGGVGYEIEAPMSTFYELPEVGSRLTLMTHLVVREDAHLLYGFISETERRLFRELLKVSNVGPRIALGVLSGMSVRGFHQAIRQKDLVNLVRLPGVGRKTAERLIVEMADRLPEDETGLEHIGGHGAPAASEAESALLALGYRPAEVTRMLSRLDTASLSTEALIREALRQVHAG